MCKPEINVTPLIDVLLVLLIIFMVVTPMKPSVFETRVPQESKQNPVEPHPYTLIVNVSADTELFLNNKNVNATIAKPEALIRTLSDVFEARRREHAFVNPTNGATQRIETTVFIRAPRGLSYGNVAKVVDAVKIAGADPVGLEIDRLD